MLFQLHRARTIMEVVSTNVLHTSGKIRSGGNANVKKASHSRRMARRVIQVTVAVVVLLLEKSNCFLLDTRLCRSVL